MLRAIEAVAKETLRSVPQVTLAWPRDRPNLGPLVLGARNAEQMADNLASLDLTLTPEQAARIEEAGRPVPLYPYWHRALNGTDRMTPSERDYLEGHRKTMGL